MKIGTAKTILFRLVIALLLLSIAAACAPGGNEVVGTADAEGVIAGFWLGLWHGMISPITFVVSLFSDGVEMYEVHNNGGWYNFGFLCGAACALGGGSCGAASKRPWR